MEKDVKKNFTLYVSASGSRLLLEVECSNTKLDGAVLDSVCDVLVREGFKRVSAIPLFDPFSFFVPKKTLPCP